MKKKRPIARVACFGEILWDCLPRGIFLGGAPLNVAYHLLRHGVEAWPISAVGRDFLGAEALRRLQVWDMDPRGIAQLSTRPTGVVQATLDDRGVAHYRIVRNVAWDRIDARRAKQQQPTPPDAIVFGTLALRETANRAALDTLLAAWPDAQRVTDLNLRPPFDGTAAIEFALRRAQIVKLNDEELLRLTPRRGPTKRRAGLEHLAREFAQKWKLATVCVTAGARGAGLLWQDRWFWEDGRPVTVRDTVGAGDAFLGALLPALLLSPVAPAVALARACRVGEFVAARDGATPQYTRNAQGLPVD